MFGQSNISKISNSSSKESKVKRIIIAGIATTLVAATISGFSGNAHKAFASSQPGVCNGPSVDSSVGAYSTKADPSDCSNVAPSIPLMGADVWVWPNGVGNAPSLDLGACVTSDGIGYPTAVFGGKTYPTSDEVANSGLAACPSGDDIYAQLSNTPPSRLAPSRLAPTQSNANSNSSGGVSVSVSTVYQSAPLMYKDTQVTGTLHFTFDLTADQALVYGGNVVNGVAGGEYGGQTGPAHVDITIKDGFVSVVSASDLCSEWGYRYGLAQANHWQVERVLTPAGC